MKTYMNHRRTEAQVDELAIALRKMGFAAYVESSDTRFYGQAERVPVLVTNAPEDCLDLSFREIAK